MYANQVLNRNANTGLSNIKQQYCQNGRKEIKNHETTERRKACCQKSGKLQTQLNSSIPMTGGGAWNYIWQRTLFVTNILLAMSR